MRLDRAIDSYLGELARRGYSPRTRTDYRRKLAPMCGPIKLVDVRDVAEVTAEECRRHLDQWNENKAGTRYHSWAVLSGFFGWLYRTGEIETNPMARIEPPKRVPSDDLGVTTISANDVRRLFDACETWQELLCLATLAYLGPRRNAASGVRRRDVDLDAGAIRFREKGGKVIEKPIPDEFAQLLAAALAASVIDDRPDAYLIPMARRQRVPSADRDNRVIWRTVKRLGRAGERRGSPPRHSSSLRSSVPGDPSGRARSAPAPDGSFEDGDDSDLPAPARSHERAMERVRDLSAGASRFGAFAVEAPSGFEPL